MAQWNPWPPRRGMDAAASSPSVPGAEAMMELAPCLHPDHHLQRPGGPLTPLLTGLAPPGRLAFPGVDNNRLRRWKLEHAKARPPPASSLHVAPSRPTDTFSVRASVCYGRVFRCRRIPAFFLRNVSTNPLRGVSFCPWGQGHPARFSGTDAGPGAGPGAWRRSSLPVAEPRGSRSGCSP